MIFDANYDNSLWCIIAGDKNNKDKVIDFVRAIPKELLDQVHSAIVAYREHEKMSFLSEDFFEIDGDVSVGENEVYSFFIDETGQLELSKMIKNGKEYDTLFELSLYGINNFNDLECFENEWVGNIAYNISEKHYGNGAHLMTCDEAEYDLIRIPFGYLLIYSLEDAISIKRNVGFIDLKNMPNDLNVSDLDKIGMVKKLKRKK